MKRSGFLGYRGLGRRLVAALLLTGALIPAGNALAEGTGYTKVYEPQTSLPLSATVCWRASSVPHGREAPSSILVYVDASLRVLGDGGEVIADNLDEWLKKTKSFSIPVLFPLDSASDEAVFGLLQSGGYADVFVMAGFEDAARLNRFTSLPHIRGIVDFTGINIQGDGALDDIVRVTNASGSKVALLPLDRASRYSVRYLQSRLLTVWADAGEDRVHLMGALTAGVNGLVTTNAEAAYGAIGFFRDDAPTMLRIPLLIGHRGMPSEFVENTLPGARAAHKAGADAIENDIWLSADGEPFILHDPSLRRLFGRGDLDDAEGMTLRELQAMPFSFRGPEGVPFTNHTPAAKSRFGAFAEDNEVRIPSLREYYEAFRDTDAVHFTEVKSHDPAIVPALRAMAEGMDTVGQTAVISFNTDILEIMRREWPGMSLGALGTEGAGAAENRTAFPNFSQIARSGGAEAALARLYEILQPWNATYNPKFTFTYELAAAGRHRGLTVWPWTYNDPEDFASAWLKGVHGLTTNFAWWMSGNAVELQAQGMDDTNTLRLKVGESLPAPLLLSQGGSALDASQAEAVVLEGTAVKDGKAAAPGDSAVIWRVKASLKFNGRDYGAYWLYSQPFKVSVE